MLKKNQTNVTKYAIKHLNNISCSMKKSATKPQKIKKVNNPQTKTKKKHKTAYLTPLTTSWNHSAGTSPFCKAAMPSCFTILYMACGTFL